MKTHVTAHTSSPSRCTTSSSSSSLSAVRSLTHTHRPPPDAPHRPVRRLCPWYVLSLTHIIPLPMHRVILFVLFVRGTFSHSHTSSPSRFTTSSSSSSLSAVRSLTHTHRPPPDAPHRPVRPLCPWYVLSLTHIVPLPMHRVILFVLFVRGTFSHSHTSSPSRCTTSSSSSSLSAVRSLTLSRNIFRHCVGPKRISVTELANQPFAKILRPIIKNH